MPMKNNAESSSSAAPLLSAASAAATQSKPRFALFIATAAGLGYLPLAPGTWGSLAGVLLTLVPLWTFAGVLIAVTAAQHGDIGFFISALSWRFDPVLCGQIVLTTLVATIGVWSASRAAQFWGQKDPQRVVIDEVSGQHLALLLGCALPPWGSRVLLGPSDFTLGAVTLGNPVSWKYLLLGFILFRVFDIWKPFPARQAESLPGGWGIMADDWIAGVYAAIGLWGARALGL
jgi:phosphatidylglycerophosphatase A